MKTLFVLIGMLCFFISTSFAKVVIQIPKVDSEKISNHEASLPLPLDPNEKENREPAFSKNEPASKHDEQKQESPQVVEPLKTEISKSEISNSEEVKAESKSEKIKNTKVMPHSSSGHSEAHEDLKLITAEQSLKWLKNGNIRFTKGYFRKDGAGSKDRQKLSKGQHPHAIVFSCSDSRVPPEVVFDQKLGEIFTVRSAGQTIDATEIGSIEYALEHLGSKLIVVLGHTSCGAVKAAIQTINGGDAGSPSLNKLVSDIHPRIKESIKEKPSDGVTVESWANTNGVVKDLISKSEIIKKHIESGEVKIIPALYDLDSGKVDWEKK